MGVDPHTPPAWYIKRCDNTGARPEIMVRILCIDSAFNGMAPKFDRPCADFSTRCGYDLFLDHITEGNLFRNRVFDLYPCIHLHKIEVQIFIHDEFDSSGPFIVDCLTGIDGEIGRASCRERVSTYEAVGSI